MDSSKKLALIQTIQNSLISELELADFSTSRFAARLTTAIQGYVPKRVNMEITNYFEE
jgi:hypothetical protein